MTRRNLAYYIAEAAANPNPRLSLEAAQVRLAMEEASTGQANKEVEVVYYARLPTANYGILNAAKEVEHQEQWEIRLPKTEGTAVSGRMRIRKTIPLLPVKGEVAYVHTTKTKLDGGGENEVAQPSSKDGFDQFKLLSDRGMYKRRYVLAIEGYKAVWEIDRYYDLDKTEGETFVYHEWVKIDFEKQEGDPERIPNLPEGFVDIITPWNRKPEQDALVRQLYDQYFLRKNEKLALAVADQASTTPEAPAVQDLDEGPNLGNPTQAMSEVYTPEEIEALKAKAKITEGT